MEKAKKFFAEFRSNFFSNNVFKENEVHANIVTATTLLNLFFICVIVFILVSLKVFKVGTSVMTVVLVTNIFLLFIPAVICFIKKGKGKWLRFFLFTFFILSAAISDLILKYNVTLFIVLPVILAARYYNKKFTIWVSIYTAIVFAIATNFSIYYGQQDLNSYNLVIDSGTEIKVESNLREAISNIEINDQERLKNIYIHLFLPKLFLFSMISFACVQISQSGKKMIERQADISEKASRIKAELNLAYNIQQGMLPSEFNIVKKYDDIDIYGVSIPAKEVGGDFYDIFMVDDDHLAICIADVSGKGVPAALFMMISKILIKIITDEGKLADEVITRVNGILSSKNQLGLFVTAWFGILDLKTGIIEFVNAGHNSPFVYRAKKERFETIKSNQNFIIAGMENVNYQKDRLILEKGDKIFLYTDGVVECLNNSEKMFGMERLKKCLEKNVKLSSKENIQKIEIELNKFMDGASQFDDITMLQINYKQEEKEKNIKRRVFSASLDELQNIQFFLDQELTKAKLSKKDISSINLVTEEIFVNTVKYGYENKGGDFLVVLKKEENELKIIFEDEGKPFNPLKQSMPDITLPKEKRKIGGLGIFLTQKIMDGIDYKWENGKNVLTVSKKI